ncbi:hypothetical protein H4582DRAFT_2084895 [Lactarius indigo]|nr:hypothetical protein H4582DRAFT_2084895 [Lactarius indigo]
MLDVIEDLARECKGWQLCRIDGSTGTLERRAETGRFQQCSNARVLVEHAHRQTRHQPKHGRHGRLPTTTGASEKRQLEALVLAKGKFKAPIGSNPKTETRQTIAELAAQLLELEGEYIEVVLSTTAGKRSVISDAGVDVVLDQCEGFEGRGIGWKSGAAAAKGSMNKGAYSLGTETPRQGRADADSRFSEVYESSSVIEIEPVQVCHDRCEAPLRRMRSEAQATV